MLRIENSLIVRTLKTSSRKNLTLNESAVYFFLQLSNKALSPYSATIGRAKVCYDFNAFEGHGKKTRTQSEPKENPTRTQPEPSGQ